MPYISAGPSTLEGELQWCWSTSTYYCIVPSTATYIVPGGLETGLLTSWPADLLLDRLIKVFPTYHTHYLPYSLLTIYYSGRLWTLLYCSYNIIIYCRRSVLVLNTSVSVPGYSRKLNSTSTSTLQLCNSHLLLHST